MSDILARALTSLRSDGLSKTLTRCLGSLSWRYQDYQLKKLFLQNATPVRLFSQMYKLGYYRHPLEDTANLRQRLPQLLKDFSIKSMYDAPCGDFSWMNLVIKQSDITYYGADVVPAMIDTIRRQYGTAKVNFRVADITSDQFPKVDLWFCRDCLFHFSNRDITLALRNFLSSGTPLVLTTTHLNTPMFENVDIRTGGNRNIDLFSAPYFFPQEVLARIPDWVEPWPAREMCLWTREQVARAVRRMEEATGFNEYSQVSG
jgi:hypothetical protein